MSTDIKVHKAVVHASDAATGIVYVKIPAVTGQKIVKVSKEGLTQSSLGVYNVPRVGDLCLVALSRDNSDVSWVSGLTADLYRADVDGVIEAINAWQTGNIQINQPGALATDLIVSRHILAGQIITDKLAANAVTTSKLATNAITSLNFSWVRSLPANAGSIAFNSRTLTVAGADFRSSDVGRTVYIPNGGAASAAFYTTISSRSSASVVTLADPCLNGSGVSGATVSFTTPPTGGYSDVGSFLDLGDGDLRTPGVYAEGVTGNISIRGNVTASSLTMVDLSGRPTAFLAEDSSTVRSFKMVTSENSALRRPRIQWTFVPGFPLPDIGTSLTLGYFTTDTGSTRSNSIEIWDGAAFVTHDMVLTAPKAKFTGTLDVDGTSLTMSSTSNSTLYFGSATLGDKISFYNYTGEYAMGIAGSTLYYNTGGNHDFRVSGTMRARIQHNAVICYGSQGGSAVLGNVYAGSWNGVSSGSGYLLLGQGANGSDPIYLRSTAGSVNIGAANSNTLIVGNGSSQFVGSVTEGSTYSGYVQIDAACSSSVHSNLELQIRSSGTVAGLSMWPTNYGIAPTLRCFNGNGESIDCGNNPGTGYAQFGANNFVTWSSVRGKTNIKKLDKRDKEAALKAFRSIETVVYDDKVGETKVAKSPRFSELNKKWIASGKSPLQIKDAERDTVSVEHDCDQNPCNGTSDNPCGIVRRHLNRRGIVAEELLPILPQAVSVNMFGEVMGIDYGVVLVEMIDVVQTLLDRVEELESMV